MTPLDQLLIGGMSTIRTPRRHRTGAPTMDETVAMSGPVMPFDVSDDPTHPEADGSPPGPPPEIAVMPSRVAKVGNMTVRRALPHRERRTVGAWCFADHMGPHEVTAGSGVDIGPHPHIGLHTVTWLTSGELLHRDSLGSEQTIRPGQLNVMTAGRGVSHAEESVSGWAGEMQGIQLWVAQPEATRHGDPGFEHHAELPVVGLGRATATVLVGSFAGATSAARRDTDLVGVDLDLRRGTTATGLDPTYEHALVVIEGAVAVRGAGGAGADGTGADGSEPVGPGNLVYLGLGHAELELDAVERTRLLLLGGVPFESKVLMWWNFVARTREEVDEARSAWQADGDRFGETGSHLDRIPAPPTPW